MITDSEPVRSKPVAPYKTIAFSQSRRRTACDTASVRLWPGDRRPNRKRLQRLIPNRLAARSTLQRVGGSLCGFEFPRHLFSGRRVTLAQSRDISLADPVKTTPLKKNKKPNMSNASDRSKSTYLSNERATQRFLFPKQYNVHRKKTRRRDRRLRVQDGALTVTSHWP